MIKFIIILALAITWIQLCHSSNTATTSTLSDKDVEILNTKRHNLIKRSFADVRKAIWQDATFELAAEFMKNLKQWSNTVTDEKFKKSELQAQIDTWSNLLNSLKADPGNCEIHINLTKNYVQIPPVTQADDQKFEELQSAFILKSNKFIKKQRDQLYAKLKDEMDIFIKDLNAAEKSHAHDLIDWYEKFNNEKDALVKQHMAMDFPRLFSKEQLDANTTCNAQGYWVGSFSLRR